MRHNIVFAIALVLVVGCAGVHIKRDLTDERGKVLGSVEVQQNLATSDGATQLVESVRALQETDRAASAERRTTKLADRSIKAGQPTSVSTRGGQVTSGYGAFGYGMWPYAYNYGQAALMYPGASPEAVAVEQMARQGSYTLPPLDSGAMPVMSSQVSQTSGVQSALVECPLDRPPANPAEQSACTAKSVKELIYTHSR